MSRSQRPGKVVLLLGPP